MNSTLPFSPGPGFPGSKSRPPTAATRIFDAHRAVISREGIGEMDSRAFPPIGARETSRPSGPAGGNADAVMAGGPAGASGQPQPDARGLAGLPGPRA
jgi:hypothetical protein